MLVLVCRIYIVWIYVFLEPRFTFTKWGVKVECESDDWKWGGKVSGVSLHSSLSHSIVHVVLDNERVWDKFWDKSWISWGSSWGGDKFFETFFYSLIPNIFGWFFGAKSNLNFYLSNKSEIKFFDQLFDFCRPIKKPLLFAFFRPFFNRHTNTFLRPFL